MNYRSGTAMSVYHIGGIDELNALHEAVLGHAGALAELSDGTWRATNFVELPYLRGGGIHERPDDSPWRGLMDTVVLPEVSVPAVREAVHALAMEGYFSSVRPDDHWEREGEVRANGQGPLPGPTPTLEWCEPLPLPAEPARGTSMIHGRARMAGGLRYPVVFSTFEEVERQTLANAAAGRPWLAIPGLVLVPELNLDVFEQIVPQLFLSNLTPLEGDIWPAVPGKLPSLASAREDPDEPHFTWGLVGRAFGGPPWTWDPGDYDGAFTLECERVHEAHEPSETDGPGRMKYLLSRLILGTVSLREANGRWRKRARALVRDLDVARLRWPWLDKEYERRYGPEFMQASRAVDAEWRAKKEALYATITREEAGAIYEWVRYATDWPELQGRIQEHVESALTYWGRRAGAEM